MDNLIENLAPFFAIFGIAAAALSVTVVPLYMHHQTTKERARLYDVVKQAQEQGHHVSPELIRQIFSRPQPTREKDMRRGAVLLAIAVGLGIQVVIAFSAIADRDLRNTIVALISPAISVLGCVGVALLLLGLRRPDKN